MPELRARKLGRNSARATTQTNSGPFLGQHRESRRI